MCLQCASASTKPLQASLRAAGDGGGGGCNCKRPLAVFRFDVSMNDPEVVAIGKRDSKLQHYLRYVVLGSFRVRKPA